MSSGFASKDKEVSLAELVALVPNGAFLGLGGSFLHRGPFAFVRELIRQEKRDIEIIKQSQDYDIDILCVPRGCCLARVAASSRWKATSGARQLSGARSKKAN